MPKIRYESDENGTVKEIYKINEHIIFYASTNEELEKEFAEWKTTPRGEFLSKNNVTFTFERSMDLNTFQIIHRLITELEAKKLTEYYLKFDIKE